MNTFQIVELSPEREAAYGELLLASESNLLYASPVYRDLIAEHTGSQAHYFLAVNAEEQVMGALPLMLYPNERFGPVINSLPYYGSNGAVTAHPSITGAELEQMNQQLLDAATSWIESQNCAAATLITNPLNPDYNAWLKEHFQHDFTDHRVGQITPVPEFGEDYEATLMALFSNPRPRNIRKAIKSGVTVRASNAKEDLDYLYAVHKDNIESIGGLAKKPSFFESLYQLVPAENWKVYIAELEGQSIAGLLVFYFNRTVEYFTPATVHDYRNLQPSALLIYEAMKAAGEEGFRHWNWGGTWQSQGGVYDFKRKWGAEDNPYYYYTRIYNSELLEQDKATLLAEYPNQYVVSFEHLKN